MIRLPPFPDGAARLPCLCADPENFITFAMPSVQCDLLEQAHVHARDRHISFEPGSHSYFVRGNKMPLSVTGLVHRLAQEFDADVAVAKMMSGCRWPRPEYCRLEHDALTPLSAEEIKNMWRLNALEASKRETWMHLQIKVLLNGGYVPSGCREMGLFAQFAWSYTGAAPCFPHRVVHLLRGGCLH